MLYLFGFVVHFWCKVVKLFRVSVIIKHNFCKNSQKFQRFQSAWPNKIRISPSRTLNSGHGEKFCERSERREKNLF